MPSNTTSRMPFIVQTQVVFSIKYIKLIKGVGNWLEGHKPDAKEKSLLSKHSINSYIIKSLLTPPGVWHWKLIYWV